MPDPSSPRARHAATLTGAPPTPNGAGARAQYGAALTGQTPAAQPNGARAKAAQAATPPPAPAAIEGSVVLASGKDAMAILRQANNPEHGPENRVKAARSMTGIPYKQQTGTALRAGTTAEALEFMDCSEFVSRVLAIDGITKEILPMDTRAIKALVSQKDKFDHSVDTPRVGDIALWEGHVGIVSGVGKGNTMKLIHASGVGKLSGENKYAISPGKYRSGTFYGYYRPIHEVAGSAGKVLGQPFAPQAAPPRSAQPGVHYKSGADGTFLLDEAVIRGQVPGGAGLPQPVVPRLVVPAAPAGPPQLPGN